MANILTLLKLEELSLVDNPANPLAMAPLYKRQETPEGDNMADKDKQELPAEITEKLEKVDSLTTENEKLRKALIENGFVITKDSIEKKAKEETITVDGEEINKSDIPAPVLKALEEADVQKREAELQKRREELLPNVKEDHANALLEKFSDDNEEMVEFFRSIDKLFADTMEEVGKQEVDADMSTPDEAFDELVKAYMTENKMSNKDYARAYASVAKTDEGKALIKKSYKGDS